ncbi:MAG: hypothetical protein K2H96_09510 [Muribaculaceae bacterium]|nr:hypothetical protein [Muribaculaceae bacterium]
MQQQKSGEGATFILICGIICIICGILLLILDRDDIMQGITQTCLGIIFLIVAYSKRRKK